MAAVSEEEENYIRLSLLLTGVSTRAVRSLFDSYLTPATLPSTIQAQIQNKKSKLSDLHNRKIINNTQWNTLSTKPDSKNFDITLMVCLLTNLTKIRGNYQPGLPVLTDTSIGADLVRIKYHRNHLAHLNDSKVDSNFFTAAWTYISDMESIGNCFKLVGNSGYGSLCLDKRKHRNVKYVQGGNAAGRLVNEPLFRRMECISEEDSYYEVELAKAEIKLDIPIQLAYIILQYAKLRMLEFYYDFLDEYLDRSDFELIETDTDSLYFAISKRNLEETVKEEKRGAFQQELMGHCNGQAYTAEHHWFPRKCCNVHAKYDKRTGGLFKLEYEGKQAVALSSKSYVVADPDADKEKVKFSCKGVNKASVEHPWNKFHSVLTTKKTINTTNRGFRSKDNTMFTYKQEKVGWNYFYVKRRVLENGIHTEPLDIALCPVGTKKIKEL